MIFGYLEDAAWWVAFFLCVGGTEKRMPGGRGYRSGQGLRRGIQLGFREGGEKEVRQRERISVRARTPSGDTTKIP